MAAYRGCCVHVAPVELAATSLRYADAILCEVTLLELDLREPGAGGRRWSAAKLDLGPLLSALRDETSRGRTRADIRVAFPADVGPSAWAHLAMVKHADQCAVNGELLTQPAVPEVMECVQWVVSQIGWQVEGGGLAPWRLGHALKPTRAAVMPSAEQQHRWGAMTGAVIAADDTNRIVFLNDEARLLLGRVGEELVGRRLLAIIPPDLHEQHLAGFGRFQISGEARILDQRVEVQALRRDGTTIDVALRIHAEPAAGRRSIFVAEIERLT